MRWLMWVAPGAGFALATVGRAALGSVGWGTVLMVYFSVLLVPLLYLPTIVNAFDRHARAVRNTRRLVT
ncbi:MAG: hypothetical protein WAW85_14030 [Gordonia sp. (in: high G+C Gram-positive bacteria)]|uniref:hypothetical protein n=1 Tax=Gordonia sp. (in: high G+C Gram-positive bacteria) TaxID=84139 RepID=UPI003BB62B9B